MSVLIVNNNYVEEAQKVLEEQNVPYEVEDSLGHAFVKQELIDVIDLEPNFHKLTEEQIKASVDRIMNEDWKEYNTFIQEEVDNLSELMGDGDDEEDDEF